MSYAARRLFWKRMAATGTAAVDGARIFLFFCLGPVAGVVLGIGWFVSRLPWIWQYKPIAPRAYQRLRGIRIRRVKGRKP